MKKIVILVCALLLAGVVGAAEITGINPEDISLKAGPTQPGEQLAMVWLEALVYPKVVKEDKIVSLGVRLTSKAQKVTAAFDFGGETVNLSSNNGLYWSGAYKLPEGIAAGLHVARYKITGSTGSITRSVEFFVEKNAIKTAKTTKKSTTHIADNSSQGEVYHTSGWPLTVKATCSALVGGSSRVLYAGQKLVGLTKVPFYKVVFEDGEIGWISSFKVEEPVGDYYKMGLSSYRSKKYSKAIGYFKDATAIDPDFVKGHYWLAKSYLRIGKLNSSYASIKRAMRINNRDMESKVFANLLAKRYYKIAKHKLVRKRYHEAISLYKKVLELKPSSILSAIELGKSYDRLGMKREARTTWSQALTHDPRNRTVLALLDVGYQKPEISPVTQFESIKKPEKHKDSLIAKKIDKSKIAKKQTHKVAAKKVPAALADDSLAIVKAGKTSKGTRIESALRSVVSLTKSLGTPIIEKGWVVKNRGEKFIVRYLCEQGSGALEAFEWMVDIDSKRFSAHNDNAKLLMTRW